MSKDSINHSKTPRLVEAENDPERQLVVSTLANHAEVQTSDWRIHESSILSEILYLEEAYGFNLDRFLESRYFLEQEQIPREEVRDFLHSFIPFGYQHPVDDIDFESEQNKFVPIAIEDWEAMLDFALKGNCTNKKPSSMEEALELFAEANPDWSPDRIFDEALQDFFADDISNILEKLASPEDLNLTQVYDLGKWKLTTYGYSMPSAYIVDSLQIAKELNISDVELLNFLEAFGLLFDGDALGCFYEAWDLKWIFTYGGDDLRSELDELRLCRKMLIGSMIAWQSHETLVGECGVKVHRLSENTLRYEIENRGVYDTEVMTVKDSLQGKLCDFRFGLKIQAEEREGSEGTKN